MYPLGIVPLYILVDLIIGLTVRTEACPVYKLTFNGFEEAFGYSIVSTVPFTAHALPGPGIIFKKSPDHTGSVL